MVDEQVFFTVERKDRSDSTCRPGTYQSHLSKDAGIFAVECYIIQSISYTIHTYALSSVS